MITSFQSENPKNSRIFFLSREAFLKAFALLKNSTNPQCQRFIIFVTDGQNQDYGQRCSTGEVVHSEEMLGNGKTSYVYACPFKNETTYH